MSEEAVLGVLGVSLAIASTIYLYYNRSRFSLLYPAMILDIITPLIAGLDVAAISLAVIGLHLYSAIIGITIALIVFVPIVLSKFRLLPRVDLDPYTWAIEVERKLTEPGPLNCIDLEDLLKRAKNTYFYDSLAGILYDHYLRDPGEFIAMVSALTMCSPSLSLELHRRLSRMIPVEAETGIPYAYARIILEAYRNTKITVDLLDYLVNTCIIACTSYGRIDHNCRSLLIETLNHFTYMCSSEPEKVKDMLVDLLKAIRGQIIVKKTSGKQHVGISIAGKIIDYRDNWNKLLPCLEKSEEKIMI